MVSTLIEILSQRDLRTNVQRSCIVIKSFKTKHENREPSFGLGTRNSNADAVRSLNFTVSSKQMHWEKPDDR